MKATLIKTNLLLALLLFMYGCGNKEFKEMFSEFKSDLESGNIEAVKRKATKQGVARLEYSFGDLSQKSNQQKLFNELQNKFSNPHLQEDGDTVIYVLSNKPTGAVSANTLTFIRKENVWLLDDYRQGK